MPTTARESGVDHVELLRVLSAVKQGDFSVRMPVRGSKSNKAVADALNDIIAFNAQTAHEFERVANAVASEGRVEERARVARAQGQWSAKVRSVNLLVGALEQQNDEMGRVIGAVAKGDLSKKISLTVGDRELRGDFLRTARLVNGMVDQLSSFASEVTRVAREVGTEGKLGGQAVVKGVGGTWKDLTDNVNSMASNLTTQVRNIAEVTTAVAKGDLSRKITVDVRGEILELKNTINTMVDQLNSFASEVTRVAREVGTEGKLGGQAVVKGVGGTWKDLTDNVNSMASNLTTQVRGIAKVVTHVANGDLKRKLVLDVKGEIAELGDTINGMIDTLAVFADQVTTVAREVGIEGKLGGQANVPGAAGLWRDLTDNVNQLAANLTTQVRAIAEVATAVTKGDLTRFITVGAQGEVAALKDNINEMIRNLKDTTRKNTEQDWLKTNLTRFTRMLQGERDMDTVSKVTLSELAPLVSAPYAAFYVAERDGDEDVLVLRAGYARSADKKLRSTRVAIGEGLVGQAAADRQPIFVSNVPSEYVRVSSGLGAAPASHLLVLPVMFEGELKAVLELGSFSAFSDVHVDFVKQLTQSIGIVINTIAGNMRTETLLQQSQALTEELTEINKRLEQQKTEVEHKNREVEQAKAALEEKAEQLSLASRYKSEFLANMSHELRTPLNSLLLLSQYLSENSDGNLSTKQVDFARTINSAGSELLELIDDILDLAKIESGTVAVNVSTVRLLEMRDFVDRSFRQLAEKKGLVFEITIDPNLPAGIVTDSKRLQQVLRNLLSNAFKFTERGSVVLKIAAAKDGRIGFSVVDTGIGIPRDKHQLIFEAFQQADGTTSRRYGGTGLGLSISRELAQLLGGELRVDSEVGMGSTFTLFLPEAYTGRAKSVNERPQPARTAFEIRRPIEPVPQRAPETTPLDYRRATVADAQLRSVLLVSENTDEVAAWREAARKHDLNVHVVDHADSAVDAARRPEVVAIFIDLELPGRDAWTTLDRIKRDVSVRHLPTWMLGDPAESETRALRVGSAGVLADEPSSLSLAIDQLARFADDAPRRVLVFDAQRDRGARLGTMLTEPNTRIDLVQNAEAAAAHLAKDRYDVLLASLEDASGPHSLLKAIGDAVPQGARPPVVFFSENGDGSMEWRWAMQTQTDWVGAFARTPERMVELVTLFQHRRIDRLPLAQQSLVRLAHAKDPQLAGRTVLVIDDDVRNIFALTATLEHHDIHVLHAEGGAEGLKRLEENPNTDLVLMDVMMPEMDGYEATRAIRSRAAWADLPVVALTAKAMKGDREKCLAAGASDYIAKPVNVDKLISVLRVWLAPRPNASLSTPSSAPGAEA
ncbi:MAG: response regulator [Archangium sp.]